MNHPLFDFLKSRQLPTGRRMFVAQAMRQVAEELGDTELVADCDASLAVDGDTLNVEQNYKRSKSQSSNARGRAMEVDADIDRVLSGMHAVAEGQSVGEDVTADQARTFLVEAFPEGLFALVTQSFEEQLANMNVLLERFDNDLAAHVDAIGVRRHADKLADLVVEFRAELEKDSRQQVSYADVKNARAKGLEQFAHLIFRALAAHGTDAETRDRLLAEFQRQNEIVADAYRRNRPVEDIDPETGEPVADDTVDDDVVEPVV
ncbi:erythromycin esterase family protein [Persicimonas caeni]|uniref:Erythromycin esterase family protein n=1 Tax=Persicimonas caeni TaxID=2292766 RepID=A0A4Y6Q2W3_PERCE|nr:erythromycin esterase family protein [Persicimonas caeni]QDG54345.1 erythromycin esterase family protein [Persicimonas caeni]QED35566.1 erythromycin esterase family protein [Persicimonas caeni]